ncbi:SET and MYND domain-containing protein 4-like isoform X2 [Gigantopelta aegis]|uniref:SET and MYND domain-containing protein 4-like isoform X2 n=1 Tax=Gigantopelta aegis TaxID=1735272 RepID=UPI001B8882AE|nr:SET and MYND domain-containing protein 4-like isoform X2 [Gigantopelta aegis]
MDSSFGNWQLALETLLHKAKTENDLIIFKNINNNYDRVNFILERNYLNLVPWLSVYFANCEKMNRKSREKSVYYRNAGNKLFQSMQYAAAVEAYNKSILFAPVSSSELGLALGNRSAALFHLEKIQDCLADINLALECQYPAESCYKLHLRKAQCLAARSHIDDALCELTTAEEKLQMNINHLKKKSLDLARQNIRELRKKLLDSTTLEVKCDDREATCCIPDLSYGASHKIPHASSAIKIMYNNKEGRYLVATQDITPGDCLIVEKPFSAVLLPDHYQTHCNHCVAVLTSPPFPCRECCRVQYCSETCRKLAWTVYHHIECKYIDLLHSIGIAHLSLRTVLVAGSKYLKEFLTAREDSLRKWETGCGCGLSEVYEQDYSAVFNLVSHSEELHVDDLFQYALTASLLLKVLIQTGWATVSETDDSDTEPIKSSSDDREYSPVSDSLPTDCLLSPTCPVNKDIVLLGSALLLHIEQLVCNAHAITELQVSQVCDDDIVDTKSQVRIATAIYPTASLMNHACDPTIISSFHKDVLVIRAVKPVVAGEEIFNCYGPHMRRMKYSERQQCLRDQYFFECICPACIQQKDQDRQFEAFKCGSCDGMVIKSVEGFQCSDCHRELDVTNHSQQLETASRLFTEALSLLEQSQIRGAVKQFKDCQDIRQRILYRHHKQLAEVEDCLARCYAMIGEFDNACQHLNRSVATTRLIHGENSIELAYELQKLAEILFNARKVALCLETIDKALKIFRLHFGDSHSTVDDLTEMKECLDKYSLAACNNKN